MNTFIKRFASVVAIAFVAPICLGFVYIDNLKHYFYYAGGSVQMWVNSAFVFNVDTNSGAVSWGATNGSVSFSITGKRPATNSTGNGTSAAGTGDIVFNSGVGGGTFDPTTATAGDAGSLTFNGGLGGTAPVATTNATGGTGGPITMTAGTGGMNGANAAATNAITGGTGGAISFLAGAGASPNTPATNAVGGDGGNIVIQAGGSGGPLAGWSRKTGNGGSITFAARNSANSTRTNSGNGGSLAFTAGNAGTASTSGNVGTPGAISFTAGNSGTAAGGSPSPGGTVNFTAGNGSTGVATNSDGGRIHLIGGSPGAGALAGDVVLARNSAGTSRGGLMVGPLLGGSSSITNILGAYADLNFPNTAAGSFSDLPITVTGVESNNCAVSLSVPWQCATNGGAYFTYSSNDTVYVRFVNNQLVTAIDPPSGNFAVVSFRIR